MKREIPTTHIKIDTQCGDYFGNVAEKAIAAYRETGKPHAFNFNNAVLLVDETSTAEGLHKEYEAQMEADHQAYVSSPEYAEAMKRAEEAARKAELERIRLEAAAPAEPTFSDKPIWDSWVEANKDGYGGAVMSYAHRWARFMEAEIAAGKTAAECHNETSQLADVEGITGFMYGAARSMLRQAWIHGAALEEATR